MTIDHQVQSQSATQAEPSTAAPGTWVALCAVDEVWQGVMNAYEVGDERVLVVDIDGDICAYDDRCPHAGTALSEGRFENNVIVCASHLWEFDAETGKGINPANCRLRRHAVRVEHGTVHVKFGAASG